MPPPTNESEENIVDNLITAEDIFAEAEKISGEGEIDFYENEDEKDEEFHQKFMQEIRQKE
jgi:hypothetical protein